MSVLKIIGTGAATSSWGGRTVVPGTEVRLKLERGSEDGTLPGAAQALTSALPEMSAPALASASLEYRMAR